MERNKDSGVIWACFFFFNQKELHYFCSSDDVEADGERKMLYQEHPGTNC